MPCWPAEPHYDQLAHGARLRRSGVDLATDAAASAWPDAEAVVLQHGRDFDHLVLAIPPGGHRALTAELRAAPGELGRRWTAVYEELRCQPTMSAQCWFQRGLGDGATHGEHAAVGAFAAPWEVFADMSHLLATERHSDRARGDEGPRGLAYLCGTLELVVGEDVDPEDVPDLQDRMRAATAAWLQEHGPALMPGFAGPDGDGFDWQQAFDADDRAGPERLRDWFFHVPTIRSDRYVLSPVGTTRCRFTADDTGLANMGAAGDWLLTGINAGCLEAAIIGGKQAARAISGYPERIFGDPRFS